MQLTALRLSPAARRILTTTAAWLGAGQPLPPARPRTARGPQVAPAPRPVGYGALQAATPARHAWAAGARITPGIHGAATPASTAK